jgi:hypothetical protein
VQVSSSLQALRIVAVRGARASPAASPSPCPHCAPWKAPCVLARNMGVCWWCPKSHSTECRWFVPLLFCSCHRGILSAAMTVRSAGTGAASTAAWAHQRQRCSHTTSATKDKGGRATRVCCTARTARVFHGGTPPVSPAAHEATPPGRSAPRFRRGRRRGRGWLLMFP